MTGLLKWQEAENKNVDFKRSKSGLCESTYYTNEKIPK